MEHLITLGLGNIFMLSSAFFLHSTLSIYATATQSRENVPSIARQYPIFFGLLQTVSLACAVAMLVWGFIATTWYLPIAHWILNGMIFHLLMKSGGFMTFATSALSPILTTFGFGLLVWKAWF